MKLSFALLSILAAAGLAAPVAEAEAAPVAEAEANPEAHFLSALLGLNTHLFGINGCCDSCNGNVGGISIGINAGIFLTPAGRLIYGNTIGGSVAFQGTVINGNLFAHNPFAPTGYGCVNFDKDGRLFVQKEITASIGWYVQDKNIVPYGLPIYACPDEHGHHYIYCGDHHHHQHKHPIKFLCN